MNFISRPEDLAQEAYYTPYINTVVGDNLLKCLKTVKKATEDFYLQLSIEKATLKPSAEVWSAKQILHHISDCERILAYRFLRLNRGDTSPTLGFDRVLFAENENPNLSITELLEEYKAVREASIQLIKNSNPAFLEVTSTYKGTILSPRILAWLIVGHNQHHLNLLYKGFNL